ncbi:alpha/beta fold hydrolase [Micromonospora sp. KC213]|uniref:alpha/beta fold hydrolase n=1 Tax=Micromonospora sp. KC213 TaxID=2530378 RepID=UPI001A9FAD97|nr:alpha/beta fold hydrolase [Micromonospora sp. KC213]
MTLTQRQPFSMVDMTTRTSAIEVTGPGKSYSADRKRADGSRGTMRQFTVHHDDVTIPIYRGGQGRPLVLCPGLNSTHADLHELIELLQRDYDVVTFDLRGHGLASDADRYSFKAFLSDLVAVMAELGDLDRAVRHYHAKGLLPEPERDHSGYRRYDAGAVVELIKIRILAEAGVPLARVRELLQADEVEFAAAVGDIDSRLRAEIRQRQRHRAQIARLAAGDNLALPPAVVEYLDRLRAFGVDERIVQAERDGWILLAAHSPERVPEWIARKREQIGDPQLTDFFLSLSQALDRTADDPPLVELAEKLAAYLTRLAEEEGEDYVDDTDIEPPLVKLMDELAFDTVPGARRLIELLRKRGWTGWTKLERGEPSTGCRRDTP